MAKSTFTVWQVPVEDLPVSWEQARLRLDAERRTPAELRSSSRAEEQARTRRR